jgi:hypothetical protein
VGCLRNRRLPRPKGTLFQGVRSLLHNHLAFAITHTRHVDSAIFLGDAEFSTSPKVRGNLRAMDDIFARQTGDVRAGTSDIFSIYDDRSDFHFAEGPGDVLAPFAAAQYDDIVLVRLCLHTFSYCQCLLMI